MSKAQVRQIIDSVRDAVAKECWIPALTAALIIPDLLGQVEYSEFLCPNGRRNIGEQYRAWFQEHVEHRYADESGFDKEWNAKNPYFTAKMCYDLRCNMLHQGSDNVDFEYRYEEDDADYSYVFELRVNACDSYGAIWAAPKANENAHKTIHVCIDIKTLCDAICDEAKKYISQLPDDSFDDFGLNLVDVSCVLVNSENEV